MIPGFGLLRRLMTLALCGAAFWGGMQFERFVLVNKVQDFCSDDTSGNFSRNGAFRPDCEGILDAFN